MALIPGTLPTGTCYGTPQDLLELFAQYLDIPAFTLSSRVLYSNGVSPLPATDYLWVDTSDSTKLKVYKSIAGAYLEYPFAGNIASGSAYSETLISGKNQITSVDVNDQFLVSQTGVNNVLKRALWSDVVKSIPAGNITYPMLSNSATQADNVAKRTAKAWVNFNGYTNNISSSFNVTSITDNGTGDYTINFTAALANATYAVSVSGSAGAATVGSTFVPLSCFLYPNATATNILTTGTCRVWYAYPNVFNNCSAIVVDVLIGCVVVHAT
jgi:hypothetical protein